MTYCQKTRYANDDKYREHKKFIMRKYINEKRQRERIKRMEMEDENSNETDNVIGEVV